MTRQEITAHALALGITPELYPEFWDSECQTCGNVMHKPCGCWPDGSHTTYNCTLPDPLSDSTRCAIWDGFYMRALGWPCIVRGERTSLLQGQPPTTTKITNVDGRTYLTGSVTAALHAAFLAKGAKG